MGKFLKLGVSIGDPNGIGLEIIIKAFSHQKTLNEFIAIVYSNVEIIEFYLAHLKLDLEINVIKSISESLKGNIFMVMNDKVLTPPLKDGSNNTVIRTKIIELINNDIQGFDVIEQSLSVFDIQKSNELFISNINFGIQPVYKFRKKVF